MHVLFLYPYLPAPGAAHGSARLVSRLLRDLASEARITLVCAHRPGERDLLRGAAPPGVELIAIERPFAADLHGPARVAEALHTAAGLLRGEGPVPVVKLTRRGIARAIDGALKDARPDLVHVELSVMGGYVRLFEHLPSVLVDHEAGGSGGRWQRFMSRVYPRFGRLLALSREDAGLIADRVPGLRVEVRPACVPQPGGVERRPEPGRVLFFGSGSHGPNEDALRWLAGEILDPLRSLAPGAHVVCAGSVGSGPEGELARARGIEVLGHVTDLEAEIDRASVVIAPLRSGRGVRIKNLEALARGAPLVTTGLGASGIIEARGGCRIADDARGLAAAVSDLLAAPRRAEELGAEGRRLVEQHHHPGIQSARTLETWKELLKA